MSERSLRRRFPVSNRKARPPHPSSSPQRRTPAPPQRSSKPWRPNAILQRWNSEPTMMTVGLVASDDENRNLTTPETVLFRPQTCTDIFSSRELFFPQSPKKFEGYSQDAKVLFNVTVEGSSGPVRTMIKLGANVDETIRLVINKYSEEGRSPQLDREAASSFELYQSHFSLASLNKLVVIGDVGSRSFYLRRGNSNRSSSGRKMVSTSFTSEIVSDGAPPPQAASPLSFLPAFIAQMINKIIRRTCKLWKLLGCLHCS